jgi:hypothetical protein
VHRIPVRRIRLSVFHRLATGSGPRWAARRDAPARDHRPAAANFNSLGSLWTAPIPLSP